MRPILNRPGRVLLVSPSTALLLCCSTALLISPSPARADIFQWEYINPADPSQGKQQSTTLAPDGAGVDAEPYAYLFDRNLTMAYLDGADLNHAQLRGTNLQNASMIGTNLLGANLSSEIRCCGEPDYITDLTAADLRHANLTDATLVGATLTGANFGHARLVNASFNNTTLTEVNLSQADLTSAYFESATLTGADFTDAQIWGARFSRRFGFGIPGVADYFLNGTGITLDQIYSTASYQNRDLGGINFELNDLGGGDFTGQNLSNVNFTGAELTGADFTNAEVQGTNFAKFFMLPPAGFINILLGTGLTVDQLYSTASYQARNLSGTNLTRNDLTGGNFIGQNLAGANFEGATLTDADFTGADVRGARFSTISPSQLYSTASYQARDLSGINLRNNNLAGANFVGQNVAGADFSSATLADADFTGAEIRGARFSTISPAQLYSTASYQARDLTGTILSGNLTSASFIGQNLTNVNFDGANLTDADFQEANLTNTSFRAILTRANFAGQTLTNATFNGATLTDANISDTDVRGARFDRAINFCTDFSPCIPRLFGTGITPTQLYSTGSYQTFDLSGINLARNNLAGSNFVGRNLTGANFAGADLTDADFSEANLTGTKFSSANLTSANFAGQNLANVSFFRATLTNADFNGALITGASFNIWQFFDRYNDARGTGITLAQLYSTASYQAKHLSGIGFSHNNLAGGDFTGQNLSGAYFDRATLTGVDFSNANLTYAWFFGSNLAGVDFTHANVTNAYFIIDALTGANFTAADARGPSFYSYDSLAHAITRNLIRPDGHIYGLDLDAENLLVVRDYDGYFGTDGQPLVPPIPITVDQHMSMAPGGTLRMVFEADAWDSTISFAPGIPVTLGGTLELTFADDMNVATQVGRTFDLLNWSGVTSTGTFAISSPYAWDLSQLYTTGEVTLTAIPEPVNFALAIMGAFGLTVYRTREIRMRPNVAAVALLVPIWFVSIAQAAAMRTVALSGQPAPGTPVGANYGSFDPFYVFPYQVVRGPVLNDAGQTAFRASLAGAGVDATNNQGIWSEGSGSLALVARAGSAAPGAPGGVNFSRNLGLELFTPVLNSDGQIAFYGGLTDGTVGLWSGASGSLALVARDGTPAPGTPDGVNLSFGVLRDYLYADLPKLNDAGQTSFWANVTGEGVNNMNDWGVWSEGSGSLALVARGGSAAPGMPANVNYDSFFIQTGFNDSGQCAFFAFVTGDGVDPSNDQGIWSEGSGGLSLVARSGTPAPGTPSGVNFREFFGFYGPVAINNAGRVAFEAFLAGDGVGDSNDEGLWSEGSGSLSLVARRGNPAPGTPSGVNFDAFRFSSWPVLNDAGQTAFRANLTGTGVNSTNNRGIWTESDAGLQLVARTGSSAAGTASGVRFADLHLPSLNEAGQTAFRATLTGTAVNSSNDRGIWATDVSGALQLIARKGSQLEVALGDFRTISGLDFVTASGNGDGRASGFNNAGQLVFWARFTNGTQGVFVSSLVAHLPGDFNNDGIVDAADYVVWRKIDNTQAGYDTWRINFGGTLHTGSSAGTSVYLPSGDSPGANYSVPEPSSFLLAAIGFGALIMRRRQHVSAPIHNERLICGRLCITLAIVAGTTLPFALANTAHGASFEFDANAKSPAVIPFDPNAGFDARGHYVSGRVPRDVKGPVIGGTNINTLLGADAFYNQGYTGTNAVVANVEAGHVWSGHETLAHVQQIPNHPSVLNEFDRHATSVGAIMGGRRGGSNPGAHQEGLAPGAQFYSGAIATQWNGPRSPIADFSVLNAATFDQYRKAFSTGVTVAGRRVDVINSSWGPDEGANGSDTLAIALDGFANANPSTLHVVAAGNAGPGPDTVFSPASAYNNMSVTALGPNPPYDRPAFFSSGGPNDYVDPVNGTKNDARQTVDIASPGQNLSSAYYGGETGGNGTTNNPAVSGPGPTGLPNGTLGGPDFYSRGGLGGTSFAAPSVAGGAALLYDAAYQVFSGNADARDARVIKAVLMNSADKTVGWNNGQVAHPNGDGGVLTTQGLDNRVGTGRMNLAAAYDQFLTGTTDTAGISSGNLGLVDDIGWDFGQVASGTTNDYYFDTPLDGGSTFTATLSWFRDRRIDAANTVFDDSYDDLNLELWSVVDGTPASLISESSSLYNESEHFSFTLPATGDYALRVRWFKEVFDMVGDANQELYGLAWWAGAAATMVAIPEPAAAILLTMAAMTFGTRRRALRTLAWRRACQTRTTLPLMSVVVVLFQSLGVTTIRASVTR